MTVTVANEIRAAGLPMFCSACHNQNTELQHIDFDAACDRGFGERDDGRLISMDDLVLCSHCVETGARLLGMERDTDVAAERDRYKRLYEEEVKLREQAVGYANRMEEALAARPDAIRVSKPRGRPKAVTHG